MEPKGVAEIRARLRSWSLIAGLLRLAHVALGLTGTVLPLTVAVFAPAGPDVWITRLLSVLAAVSVAVFTAFDVGNRANGFRAAWQKLNVALLKFDQGLIDSAALIEAYDEGEALLGKADPDPFGSRPHA